MSAETVAEVCLTEFTLTMCSTRLAVCTVGLEREVKVFCASGKPCTTKLAPAVRRTKHHLRSRDQRTRARN